MVDFPASYVSLPEGRFINHQASWRHQSARPFFPQEKEPPQGLLTSPAAVTTCSDNTEPNDEKTLDT